MAMLTSGEKLVGTLLQVRHGYDEFKNIHNQSRGLLSENKYVRGFLKYGYNQKGFHCLDLVPFIWTAFDVEAKLIKKKLTNYVNKRLVIEFEDKLRAFFFLLIAVKIFNN